MLRTQCGELPTHFDEIKRFVVRLAFQRKRLQSNEASRRTCWRDDFAMVNPGGAMSGAPT
jgi:hypothetical protein